MFGKNMNHNSTLSLRHLSPFSGSRSSFPSCFFSSSSSSSSSSYDYCTSTHMEGSGRPGLDGGLDGGRGDLIGQGRLVVEFTHATEISNRNPKGGRPSKGLEGIPSQVGRSRTKGGGSKGCHQQEATRVPNPRRRRPAQVVKANGRSR